MNMLALLTHTFLSYCDDAYRLIRAKLPTRKTFFDDLRALLRYIPFESWNGLMDFRLRGLKIGPSPSKTLNRDPQGYCALMAPSCRIRASASQICPTSNTKPATVDDYGHVFGQRVVLHSSSSVRVDRSEIEGRVSGTVVWP